MQTSTRRDTDLKIGYFTERPYCWMPEDPVGNEDRMKCVRSLAEEVAPALREYGKELGLPDPYEQEPGMVRAFAGANRLPVADRDPLPSLGLQF